MKYKSLFLTLCLAGTLCFTGCTGIFNTNDKAEDSTMSAEEKEEEFLKTFVDPSMKESVTISSKGNDIRSNLEPALKFDKFIWEKEKEELKADTLKLTSEWSEKITVGELSVSSTEPTDISFFSNYFYEDGGDYSELEKAYLDPHYAIGLQTDKIKVGNLSSMSLRTESTSYKDNLIVESIQLTGISNVLEDDGSELKSFVDYESGTFGFGSTYLTVKDIIGESKSVTTNETGDFNISTALYTSENAEMILNFSWKKDGNIDNAVLTSIYWKPTTVSAMLHSQEGIMSFEGAPGSENITYDGPSQKIDEEDFKKETAK